VKIEGIGEGERKIGRRERERKLKKET